MIRTYKGRAHTMADQIKMRQKTHLYFTPKIAKPKVLIKRKCLFWVIFWPNDSLFSDSAQI